MEKDLIVAYITIGIVIIAIGAFIYDYKKGRHKSKKSEPFNASHHFTGE